MRQDAGITTVRTVQRSSITVEKPLGWDIVRVSCVSLNIVIYKYNPHENRLILDLGSWQDI